MKNATIVLSIALLVLAGCAKQADTMAIGWTGPLTGDNAIIGVENLRGVEIAADEINANGGINGRKIRVIAEDDQMEDTKTVTAYNKLTSVDDVRSILSVTYGGVLALAERANADGTIIINSLDTSEEIANAGENVFGIGIYDEGIGYALARHARETLLEDRVGLVYNNGDPFAQLVADAFASKFNELGGNIPVVEKYTPEDKTFRTQLLKLQEAKLSTVVVIGYDEAGLILRQARELDYTPQFLGIDTVLSQGFKDNAGDAYEGLQFTSWEPADTGIAERFLASYRAKHNAEPEQLLFAATGYDAMHVLAKAMSQSDGSTASIKAKLKATNEMPGLTGTLTMSPDGIVRTVEEKMYVIKAGTPTPLVS